MSIGDDIVAAIAGVSNKYNADDVWDAIAPFFGTAYPTKALYSTTVRSYENIIGYHNSGWPSTGTIKITLPFSWTNSMIQMVIRMLLYSSGGADPILAEILCQGYTYSTTPAWTYPIARMIGTPTTPLNQVRFAYDGSKCCILLGNTGSNWYNVTVDVHRFLVGFNANYDWSTGWGISMITSEAGITVNATVTNLVAGRAVYAP